jgi:hypothetical protein
MPGVPHGRLHRRLAQASATPAWYVIFTTSHRRRCYRFDDAQSDVPQAPSPATHRYLNFNIYTAFTIGEVARTIHGISDRKKVWRPNHDGSHRLTSGYMLGKYAVLDEVPQQPSVQFPITRTGSRRVYADARDAIDDARPTARFCCTSDLS